MGWIREFGKELTGKDLGDPKVAANSAKRLGSSINEGVDGFMKAGVVLFLISLALAGIVFLVKALL